MLRRLLLSAGLAVLLWGTLTAVILAQDTRSDSSAVEVEEDAETALAPSIQPVVAMMTETVPVTLTVTLPGPSGVQTISVPVLISFDIQIGLSDVLTASVAASAEQVEAEVVEIPTGEPTAPPTATPTATPLQVPAATPTPTPARIDAPTATPAALPEEDEEEVEPEPTVEPDVTVEPEAEGEEPLVSTSTPTETVTSEIGGDMCPDPRSVITSPAAGGIVTGSVQVIGTAQHENFQYYKIEYAEGPDVTDGYVFLTDAGTQVQDGVLAIFDSTEFVNGQWVLRLTVVDNTGNFPPPCEVPITIEN